MQGNYKVLVALTCLVFIFSFNAFAQVDSLQNNQPKSDCEASLSIATGEFNAGRFFSLPSILAGCLENGFTKEQKVRAYILLCQVYLINDNPTEAEASYLKLLQADPEYIATPELDPVDVVYLSKKFTTRPVFTPHVRLGVNTCFTSLIHRMYLSGNKDDASFSNSLRPGFQLGGGLDWNLSDRISVSGDLTLAQRDYSTTVSYVFKDDRSAAISKITWMDVPLYIKYQDFVGRWRPYGYLGYSFHFRLSSHAKLTYLNIEKPTDGGQPTQKQTEGPNVNFTSKQNFLNQSLVLGGGVKYKIGKNYLFADLRIMMGMSNLTNPNRVLVDKNKTFDSNNATYNFAYDLYRLNSINLSVGYIFPVYNPRKKGGWEPKGLLGKILYGDDKIENK